MAPAANLSLKLRSSAADLSTDAWSMFGRQGMLLTDTSEKLDSMNLLKYMAPVASLALIPAVIVLEPNIVRCVACMEAPTVRLGNSNPTEHLVPGLEGHLFEFTHCVMAGQTLWTSAFALGHTHPAA